MIRLTLSYSEAGRLSVSGLRTIVYVVNAYSSFQLSPNFTVLTGRLQIP